ncbi:hypothetical protein [Mangrovimonas sp. ST2L15]|uniref:hypothetical protein n=1 Tax=Mangrovimonas sp. ST2L15 TaxID=1645916 RepID=UPI0012FCBC67|nr:hypothetical protein [Mangrovimonas sp. ST2L15]
MADINFNSNNPKTEIPAYFKVINDIIFMGGTFTDDLDNLKKLSVWLHDHIPGGPGLSKPSEEALRLMLAGKGGVCSDMAQIFNNFCVLNDLEIREWGTTRAPFDPVYGGHSFNEVFCKELDQWVMVDVYYCLLFYSETQKPLSVMEFFDAQRRGNSISVECFKEGMRVDDMALERNYFQKSTIPFLICNYSNRTYDRCLKLAPKIVPVFVIHFWIYLLRKSYYYLFPLDRFQRIFS